MKRVLFALALLIVPSAARADAMPHIDRAVFVPFGVNVGYGMNPSHVPNGLLLGGEVSLVYFDRFRWIGAYGDVLHDFGAKQTRWTVGPEIGALFFTVDGGYLGGDSGHGYVFRFVVDAVIPHLYARYGHFTDRDESFGEIGLLLKLPAPVKTWDYERPAPAPPPPPPPPSGTPEGEEPTPSGPLAPDDETNYENR